ISPIFERLIRTFCRLNIPVVTARTSARVPQAWRTDSSSQGRPRLAGAIIDWALGSVRAALGAPVETSTLSSVLEVSAFPEFCSIEQARTQLRGAAKLSQKLAGGVDLSKKASIKIDPLQLRSAAKRIDALLPAQKSKDLASYNEASISTFLIQAAQQA